MEQAIHKRIKIISIVIMVLFTVAAAVLILLLKSVKINFDFSVLDIEVIWLFLMLFPLFALIVSYLICHKEKTLIGKLSRYAFYLFPVILAVFVICIISENTILIAIGSVLQVLCTFLALLYLFAFTNPLSLTSTIIFLSFMIVGIAMRRLHLNFAGVVLTLSLGLFSGGCFIYGIRCFYLAENNKFLKNVMFFGNLVLAISFLGLLFKLQRWPGGDLFINIGRFSTAFGTVIVLLMLPSSGFIDWKSLHKKILKRLIFPWTLLFLLFIIRFLAPELDNFIWERGNSRKITHGFNMVDYKIKDRNNLNEK